MTRGNQREKAREKNLKKQAQEKKKAGTKDGNMGKKLDDRRQRDADAMREKQEMAKAKKEQETAGASGGK